MDSPPPLVCQGRPVDRSLQPTGEPCGATYQARRRMVGGPDPRYDAWGVRPATEAEQIEEARAKGWSVPADAPPTCPRCRKPDPAIARGLDRPAPADRTNPKEL